MTTHTQADLDAAARVIEAEGLAQKCRGCDGIGEYRHSIAIPRPVCHWCRGSGRVSLTPEEALAVDEYGRPCGSVFALLLRCRGCFEQFHDRTEVDVTSADGRRTHGGDGPNIAIAIMRAADAALAATEEP